MNIKSASIALTILFLPIISKAQSTIANIKICHNTSGTLKRVETNRYIVDLNHSRLAGFHSTDNKIKYYAADKRLDITGTQGGSYRHLILQLTAQGLQLSTKDTSISANTLAKSFPPEIKDTTLSVLVGDVFVLINCAFGRPYRIYCDIAGSRISILLEKAYKLNVQSDNIWSLIIESTDQKSKFTYVESRKSAPHITILDEVENNGIAFYALKSKCGYSMLMGLVQEGNNWLSCGSECVLKYKRNGKLKESKSKFNFDCD